MKSLGIIQGWIFELNGVLYDGTAWRRWLLQLLSKRGLHTHYDVFFRHWDLEFASQIQSGKSTFQQAIEKMLSAAGMTAAHINEITPALRSKRKCLAKEQRPLPGVAQILKFLAASGYQLAVLDEVDCEQGDLGEKLLRLNIASYFDFMETSGDGEECVLHNSRFQQAISAMHLSPDEVIFAGHDLQQLVTANALGIPTVSVACPQAEKVADWHVECLPDLVSLLSALPKSRRAG
jgi:phosphoglycolate phosphatase-like HAD superfamily hydrolase